MKLVKPAPLRSHAYVNEFVEMLTTENRNLKLELDNMHKKYEMTAKELSLASDTINQLKRELNESENKVCDLQVATRSASESAKKLNRKLNNNRKLYEEEKEVILKNIRGK